MRQEVVSFTIVTGRLASWLLACLLVATSGCSSWDFTSKLPWADPESKVKQSKFDKPSRIVAIWTPTTLTAPGKPVTRGFGGRLYFYNDAGTTVPVEGQLLVYAYDDTHRKQERGVRSSTGGLDEPDRKYAFTPEQFSSHYSPTDLGASYSVWIPWGPHDGPQSEVSLVPVFTATAGNIVMGQSSRHVLKGSRPDLGGGESAAPRMTRLPPSNEPQANAIHMQQSVRQTELRSTTITLPDQTAERLTRLGPTIGSVSPMQGMTSAAMPQMPSQVEPSTIAPVSYQADVQNQSTPNGAAPAVPRVWSDSLRRPDYFARPKFPAPTSPGPQSTPGLAPTAPSPTGLPYVPPSSPEPIQHSPGPVNSAAAMQTGGSHW